MICSNPTYTPEQRKFVKPEELPDLETIKCILFDLEDTGLYTTEYDDDYIHTITVDNFRNGLAYHPEFITRFDLGPKLVKYYEMVEPKTFLSDNPFIPVTIESVERCYQVLRYLALITITSESVLEKSNFRNTRKNNRDLISNGSKISVALKPEIEEVLKRIELYLESDLKKIEIKTTNDSQQLILTVVVNNITKLK